MEKKLAESIADLKEHYTPLEAKELIDGLLTKFGKSCRIDFRKKDAEIIDSYLVKDVDARRLICEIIARTGITKRQRDDLSAEWRVHNVSYQIGFLRWASKDVSLDYNKDPRGVVRLATGIFRKLHMM